MAKEDDVAARWFALQTHAGMARDLGVSYRALASKVHFLELPARTGLPLMDAYRPERDTRTHIFAGWVRGECSIRRRPFWYKAGAGRRLISRAAHRMAAYRSANAGIC